MSKRERILKMVEFSQNRFLRDAGYDDSKPRNTSEEWCVCGAKSMHEQMFPLISAMVDRIEQLEGALEFYGNPSEWWVTAYNPVRECSRIDEKDIEKINALDHIGGKRARQALTQLDALDKLLKLNEEERQ